MKYVFKETIEKHVFNDDAVFLKNIFSSILLSLYSIQIYVLRTNFQTTYYVINVCFPGRINQWCDSIIFKSDELTCIFLKPKSDGILVLIEGNQGTSTNYVDKISDKIIFKMTFHDKSILSSSGEGE